MKTIQKITVLVLVLGTTGLVNAQTQTNDATTTPMESVNSNYNDDDDDDDNSKWGLAGLLGLLGLIRLRRTHDDHSHVRGPNSH